MCSKLKMFFVICQPAFMKDMSHISLGNLTRCFYIKAYLGKYVFMRVWEKGNYQNIIPANLCFITKHPKSLHEQTSHHCILRLQDLSPNPQILWSPMANIPPTP